MAPRSSPLRPPLLEAVAVLLLASALITPAASHGTFPGFAFVPRPDALSSCAPSSVPGPVPGRRGQMDMKVSKGKSKRRKDSALTVLNHERVRLAGRRGTKRFVDPTKLFIGNLPYTANEARVLGWLGEQLGGTGYIDSLKIIRDYRTGKSKGFGFVTFKDPIFATSAMETVKGRMLDGRVVNLNQGQRRMDPNVLYVQKREKAEEGDEEGEVIDSALDDAEGFDNEDEGENEGENEGGVEDILAVGDFDSVADMDLFGDDDEENTSLEDFVFDGVFEDEYKTELGFGGGDEDEETDMNREQRREAARRKPRRKLPHKGFGPQVET